jgi:photoactive yellow protein
MILKPRVSEDLYEMIDNLTVEQLDELPYGIIQLDAHGTVLKFNTYESQLASMAKEAVLGRNFFKEVAPCTDVQDFYGRFEVGVKAKELRTEFRYHFKFKQNPRDVIINLFYSQLTQSVWVLVHPDDDDAK